ncbi:MAG: sulfatase [Verrucomicrobiae bacterium]|nr:sulfatase [Verrucomicrobiae bacterium]NNJ43161.1 sulfatase [Akkermansiaceae bacterium]
MKIFLLILILPALCFANDPAVAISGKIVGRGGVPVIDCIVSLEGTKLTTLSNAAGEFVITSKESVSETAAPYIVNINCPNRPRRILKSPSSTASLGEIKIYKQPNFVIILTDDQGYSDLGAFSSGTAPKDGWLEKDRIPIPTPRIDRMAEEGVKFSNFYAQTYCGPSRVQLMTGSYAARVATKNNGKGKFGGLFNGTGGVDLHPPEITIAEVLKKAGYATGMIGKWHLGIHKGYKPVDQGFDYWWGARYSNDNGTFPLYENEKSLGTYDDMAHVTRDFTTRAIKWIGEHKDEPFFMWLAHTMPHKKIDASKQFKGSTERGLYGDVINEIDWYTGQLLDSLKKWEIDENTIVVFFSDNGHWGKSENAGSSYPLRGSKMGAYEGGHRVCFVARCPGIIPPGTVNHEIATSMDLMPTFAKLAGATMPADRVIDGKNIEPLLRMKEGVTSPHKAYFFYKTTTMRSVREGKWKLHIKYDDKNIIAAELYDLEADIGEKKDVSGSNPAVVSRLMDLAKTARNDIGDFYVDGTGHRMAN